MAPPTFVRFSLFLILTHSKTLIHLAPTVQTFKILEDPLERFSKCGTPDFRPSLVLLDIYNHLTFNTVCLAV